MATRSAAKKTASTSARKAAAAKPKAAPARAKPAVKAPVKVAAKPAVKAATKPVAKPAAAPKEKIKKPKLVRDSFTMPEAEYQVLGDVKKACVKAGFEVKKSELLRIGVALIRKTDLVQLKAILASLPPLKAGRPKKHK